MLAEVIEVDVPATILTSRNSHTIVSSDLIATIFVLEPNDIFLILKLLLLLII